MPSSRSAPARPRASRQPNRLTLPMRRGISPPFFQMSEYDFQDLCCDLFNQEPEISSCEVYGKRGEAQRGIDLLARTSSGGAIEVGQCKCTRQFPPTEIKKASAAFFAHWEAFWQDQQVRRFVLFVACDLNSTHQQDEITRQEKLFLERGLRYEAWSAKRLAKRLKPRRDVAREYFDLNWVDRLCGPLSVSSPPPSPTHLAIVDESIVRQLESMASLVSHSVSIELEVIRNVYREGRPGEAIRRAEHLLGEPALPPALRSELLVLAARSELDRQGPDATRSLLAQVPATVPGVTRLTALVEYRATGGSPDHALALLAPLDDLASRQLTAAILLEIGRLDAAASVLAELSAADPADPETLRLSAFLHLLAGRLQQAQLAIAEALEREPRWAALRWAAGMIAYQHSVSPALPHVAPWPEPVNWHFVRRGDTSVARLNEAALHFGDLLKATDPPPAERRRLETWYLASLANNSERQLDAETFCRKLLDDQPAHAPAVLWAVARSFDVDLKPSQRALEALIRAQQPEYEQILALVAIYLSHKRHRKARELLDRERPRFEQARASQLWAYWLALTLTGAKRDATPFLDQLAGTADSLEARQARAVAMGEIAKATQDPQPLLRHLADSFAATSDPAFLFAACAVAAERSDWAFVAERREALLDLIGTPEAVQLAAVSAYHTGRFQVCREILDGRRDLFRHGKLPTDLRELRVATARQLGALSDALAEAEDLVHEDPSTSHLVNLARVYLDSGDLKALALTARRLLKRSDLAPRDALKIARLVHLEDPALARALWSQATATPIADPLVAEAYELASRLGLGRDARPLFERMTRLAQTGQAGLRAVGLHDLRQLVEDRRRHLEDVDKAYSRAAIPIHLVAAETGIPLADLFHDVLADNESDPRPRAQGFLLIRHGGRPLAEISQPPRWRLHLDVTAVLLAAHLDILDAVEGGFRPLRVADDLILALIEMRHALSPAQPDHYAASEAVLEFLDSGRLKLLSEVPKPAVADLPDLSAVLGPDDYELLAAAAFANGAFVQLLPLTGRDGTVPELPPALVARVSGLAAVLAALRQAGAVPGEQLQRAFSDLGLGEAEHPGAPLAGPSMAIFCARGIAERLARLGLLATSSRAFEMHLHPREADHIRYMVRTARRAAATATWLTALIERIGQGISTGTYEVVVAPELPGDAPNAQHALRSHALRSLQTVLLCQLAPGDVLWIDDRWANSFVARDERPIVGINEILRALVAAGALPADKHYATLARLRAANLRWIPLDADELLHDLAQSQVDAGGNLVETHELRTLRAAVAAAVERFDILQLPAPAAMPEAGRYEGAIVTNLYQAVRAAIGGVWCADVPAALAEARCDWLVANLHYDHRTVSQFLVWPVALDEVQLAGLDLGALVSEGFALQAGSDETLSRRREYFAWLERRVLAPCLYANPAVLIATAEYLKRFLLGIRSERPAPIPEAAWHFHLVDFVRGLPLPLRHEIGNDQELMASLDLAGTSITTIGGHAFDHQELTGAIAEVIDGATAEITTLRSRTIARFAPAPNHAIALTVGEETIKVPLHEEFLLLTKSVIRRRELLDAHPEWFDCPVADREAAVATIATEENLLQRMEMAERWKQRSAAWFYRDLRETVTTERQLSQDQLIPLHLESLLEHLRLKSASTLPPDVLVSALGAGADRLVIEEGLAGTVKRLWSLPVPLPASVFAVLPTAAQKRGAFLDSLTVDAMTPLERTHLIRLHLAAPCGTSSRRRAESLTRSLLSPSAVHEWKLFLRLFQWTFWQIELHDTVTWSPHARLLAAWLHADKLLHTLLAAGVDAEELLNRCPSAPGLISPANFRVSEHASRDAAHPVHVSLPRLVATSIAYAWEGTRPADALAEIRSGLQDLIGAEFDSGPLPIEEMLADLTMAQNGLGTYLNRDLGEGLQSIIDARLAAHLCSVALRHELEAAVQAMDEQPDSAAWALVRAILGNLEPPPGTRERLARALERLSASRLLRQGVPVALTVIGAASQQARYFHQNLKDHLKQELVTLAAEAPSLDPAMTIATANLLLVATFNVTVAGEADLTHAAGEIAKQVLLLLDAWPGLGPLIATGLREVCGRLSLSQQSRFARLLLRLRTT
jgi:hypothetical protein